MDCNCLSSTIQICSGIDSLEKVTLFVEGPDRGVEFLVDSFSLTELPTAGWSQQAADSIELHRKGDLTVKVTNAGSNANNVEIKVTSIMT